MHFSEYKKIYIASICLLVFISAFVWVRKIVSTVPVLPVNTQVEDEKKSHVVYKVIGTSTSERNIESFTYGSGEKHLVFVGGIHGGYEWNTVLLAYQFIDYLDKNHGLIPSDIKVTVIPVLNPDGLFRVTGKAGRFALSDVSKDQTVLASGRFNANNVDLNRNFNCKWQKESKWQSRTVSAGTSAFSEPESLVFKKYVEEYNPELFVFWHSQANTVYASKCEGDILPETITAMNTYAKAAGYLTESSFTNYQITGDVADWLSQINIPAITVELKTHETIEFDKNILGINALLKYYSQK